MFLSIRKIYYLLPVSWRFLCRRILFLPHDLLTYQKRKEKNIPPTGLIFTGSGDFELSGDRFTQRLKQYAGLQANSRVLDIGCGIGRLARPLTNILTPPGKYCGFDVVKIGIRWCDTHIKSKYPHFEFTYVPLSNDLYNTDGENAANFHFPYADNEFNIVAAISVFTHLLPHETSQYLAETARVLEPGGIAYFTFFIHEKEKKLPSHFNFPVQRQGYSLMDEHVSRANVLYQQDFLFDMIQQNKLDILEWRKGSWNTASGIDLQDTLILQKRQP